MGCRPEVDNVWKIAWPPTEVGNVEMQKCPGGTKVIGMLFTVYTIAIIP